MGFAVSAMADQLNLHIEAGGRHLQPVPYITALHFEIAVLAGQYSGDPGIERVDEQALTLTVGACDFELHGWHDFLWHNLAIVG